MLYLIFRRLKTTDCLFVVVFIGGFIFHVFWEAAPQYMLPYFVLIIPYGVMGLKDLTEKVTDKVRSLRKA